MPKKNYFIVVLIFLVFFAISFLTNILGSINPNVSDNFKLNGKMTGMLPFSFFVAYGLMSIPSGIIVQKYREKKSMTGGWLIATVGALLFANMPFFPVFLCSLFLIGCGMALLQVAINPLLRILGGEEHYAFFSVFAQLIFCSASFLSPHVYSYLVTNLSCGEQFPNVLIRVFSLVTPAGLPWVSLYWLFALISFTMLMILIISRFPKVERREDEIVGAWEIHLELFRNKTVLFFFIGIFAYAGTEQGIVNWISEFLRTYHGYKPETEGVNAVSWFWGMMTIGSLLGLGLLKISDSKVVLRIFALAAIIILSISLFGNNTIALYGFPALGFCLSLMCPIIFSLALNSVTRYHGTFSGILCTAFVGGAFAPLLIGFLKDMVGLRCGMFFLYITLGYILSISYWANPLIANATISNKKQN